MPWPWFAVMCAAGAGAVVLAYWLEARKVFPRGRLQLPSDWV
jgi:hypothetical protein